MLASISVVWFKLCVWNFSIKKTNVVLHFNNVVYLDQELIDSELLFEEVTYLLLIYLVILSEKVESYVIVIMHRNAGRGTEDF